ncbi:MAG: hypothetical protein KDG57_20040 [Rhodoferax sp.]|nr:hypothetical protein [Rhodoferax sp.]
MTAAVEVKVTRPCLVAGVVHGAGAVLELPPLQALDAVETGRLAFVKPGDANRCMAARRDDIARQMRRIHVPTGDGGPWRPAGIQ